MERVKQTLLMERVGDQMRLAVVEDGQLCELYCQRPGMENLSGNIYLGRCENVLPGMNAAFVDIGMDKNGFLAAGDVRADARELSEALKKARIEKLVRPGQPVLAQVVKSQPGAKGPRLASHITLPGRLLALLPEVRYVGVSRKITDAKERERLRGIGAALLDEGGAGLILRTAAAGGDAGAIRDEYARLRAMWADIRTRAEHGVAPRLIYDDNALALKAVRDMLGEGTEAIWTDGAELYGEVAGLARALAPEWADRVRPHDGAAPLFDLYRVDAQLEKALQKYVWLKSGGSLVIEETEALTVVDVNTGKNVGKRDVEDTIFKANCEAAREIMRQLRLRDIGGIVVIDFIDMADAAHRQALLDVLRQCAARDRNRVNVAGITQLGLVELTRKRERQSLARQLLHTCSDCGGNGVVLSHETAARRVQREIWRRRRGGDGGAMLAEAPAEAATWLLKLGNPAEGEVYVRADDTLKGGEYRISPLDLNHIPERAKKLKPPAK